jgi:hypothetical protein
MNHTDLGKKAMETMETLEKIVYTHPFWKKLNPFAPNAFTKIASPPCGRRTTPAKLQHYHCHR